MPIGKIFASIYNHMIKLYGTKKGKSIYYAWVKKHGYDDTKDTLPKEDGADWEYELATGWLDGFIMDESVKDNLFNESIKEKSETMSKMLPEGMQLYKFKAYAIYPTKSANKRNYGKSVLMEAAHKWTGKPLIFDHDAEDSEKATGIIGESGYRSDSFEGEQPKEGVWMSGVGVMSKEQFVKVHGIPGKMPAIIKGGSIGAGGKAHPTVGGEEGEVDMDYLTPVEYSITPFPGVANSEIRYEPVFIESVIAVRDAAEKGNKLPQPSHVVINEIQRLMLPFAESHHLSGVVMTESDNISSTLKEVDKKMEDNELISIKELNAATSVVANSEDSLDPRRLTNDQDAKAVLPDPVGKPAGTPPPEQNPTSQADGPNKFVSQKSGAPAGFPSNNSQDLSVKAHPPEVNDADGTLSLEVERLVDEFSFSKKAKDYVYEASNKKWVQKAIKKPGSLRAAAKRAGVIKGDEPIPVSWLKAKAKAGGKTGRRARLALTMRSWHEQLIARLVEALPDVMHGDRGKQDSSAGPKIMHGDVKADGRVDPKQTNGVGSSDDPKAQPMTQNGDPQADGRVAPAILHGMGSTDDPKSSPVDVVNGDSKVSADMGADGAVDGSKDKASPTGTGSQAKAPATAGSPDKPPATAGGTQSSPEASVKEKVKEDLTIIIRKNDIKTIRSDSSASATTDNTQVTTVQDPEGDESPTQIKAAIPDESKKKAPVKEDKIKEVIKPAVTETDTLPLKGGTPTLQSSKEAPTPGFKSISEVADYYFDIYHDQLKAWERVRGEILQGKWAHLSK